MKHWLLHSPNIDYRQRSRGHLSSRSACSGLLGRRMVRIIRYESYVRLTFPIVFDRCIGWCPLSAADSTASGQSFHTVIRTYSSAHTCSRSILVYSGVFTFLVDAYPLYAASALGANSFTRSCFAAGFPLFGNQSTRRTYRAPGFMVC